MGLKQWYENAQLITPLKRCIFPWTAKLVSQKIVIWKTYNFPGPMSVWTRSGKNPDMTNQVDVTNWNKYGVSRQIIGAVLQTLQLTVLYQTLNSAFKLSSIIAAHTVYQLNLHIHNYVFPCSDWIRKIEIDLLENSFKKLLEKNLFLHSERNTIKPGVFRFHSKLEKTKLICHCNSQSNIKLKRGSWHQCWFIRQKI